MLQASRSLGALLAAQGGPKQALSPLQSPERSGMTAIRQTVHQQRTHPSRGAPKYLDYAVRADVGAEQRCSCRPVGQTNQAAECVPGRREQPQTAAAEALAVQLHQSGHC